MKRSSLIFFALICGLVAFAQLELKPAIGFNLARTDSDPIFPENLDSLTTGGKAGYQFGASLAIGRKLYIEPGVFYTRLSQELTPSNVEKTAFTYSANYLRIPVNFGFQFIGHNTSFAGLKIFVGPSMFIPLSVKENDYPVTKEDLKSPQFDFSVGAGLNIWLFFLDVSYGWGLTPQFEDDPIEAKMQAFYANLGFRIKLKKEIEQ
jgi:hypothetical protein